MLAYVLASTVGLGSLAIYMTAFFFPEIHRKNDFIWSGVGLFYALVLWVCAGQINGGLLLGQVASVALLSWSVTQTISLRRQLTPQLQQTEIPSAEKVKNTVQEKVSSFSLTEKLSQLGKQVGGSATAAKDRLQQTLTSPAPDQNQGRVSSRVQVVDYRTPRVEQLVDGPATVSEVAEIPLDPVENAQTGESLVQPSQLISEDEGEAGTLAVEIDLVEDATEALQGEQEGTISELARPHPPDPELVEAAVHDAEEKHLEASPPEVNPTTENPSPS